MRVFFLGLLPLLLSPPLSWGVEITSIVPAAAPPGTTVTITGGPFRPGSRLLFGPQNVPPGAETEKRLTFTVPLLPEGDYTLSLADPDGRRTPVTLFRVLETVPRIDALSPAFFDSCSIQQGYTVVLTGDFPPQSQLLLDGAIIRADRVGKSEIAFTVPPLKGGMHQVEVAGRNSRKSLPHALFVDQTPRITAVSQGADQVTSYEVVITGENFLFDSTLAVNGTPLKRAVEGEMEQAYTGVRMLGGDDYVRYVDCSTMIYVRHPVTREPQSVTLRVVNPGGEQSPSYVVAIP